MFDLNLFLVFQTTTVACTYQMIACLYVCLALCLYVYPSVCPYIQLSHGLLICCLCSDNRSHCKYNKNSSAAVSAQKEAKTLQCNSTLYERSDLTCQVGLTCPSCQVHGLTCQVNGFTCNVVIQLATRDSW